MHSENIEGRLPLFNPVGLTLFCLCIYLLVCVFVSEPGLECDLDGEQHQTTMSKVSLLHCLYTSTSMGVKQKLEKTRSFTFWQC